MKIQLDFEGLSLKANLYDTQIARGVTAVLPCTIKLTGWGNELYGPIGKDLGEEYPVPTIPPGGLAYTRNGHLLCIFFGQDPAWPVEYIGQIDGDSWKQLLQVDGLREVRVTVL